jgi:hypothetical protein
MGVRILYDPMNNDISRLENVVEWQLNVLRWHRSGLEMFSLWQVSDLAQWLVDLNRVTSFRSVPSVCSGEGKRVCRGRFLVAVALDFLTGEMLAEYLPDTGLLLKRAVEKCWNNDPVPGCSLVSGLVKR